MKQKFIVLSLQAEGAEDYSYVIVKNTPPVSSAEVELFMETSGLIGAGEEDLIIIRSWVLCNGVINHLVATDGQHRPLVASRGLLLQGQGNNIFQPHQLIGTQINRTKKRRPQWPPYTHFLAKRKN
jgi:hypothetical protein